MARKKKAAKKIAKKKVYHRTAAPVAEPEPVVESESMPEPQSEPEPMRESKGRVPGMFFGPDDPTRPGWPAGAPNPDDVAVAYKNDWGDWVFKMKKTNRKIIIKES